MINSNPVIMNALNAANNQQSAPIDSQWLVTGSIQASFSSDTIGGTLTLQGSNDPINTINDAGVIIPVNWNTIGSASTVTSGAVTMQTVANLNYRWLQVLWTASAGTGTITVNGFFIGYN
jgi:hypothetical protein